MNKNATRYALLLLPIIALSGCGGSSSGADVSSNIPSSGGGGGSYNGPVSRTADVAAFKLNVWDNLSRTDRCGECHVQGAQAPAFVRNDDINLAYNAANTVVNLTTPGNSEMVSKVAGGHNCWLDTDNECAVLITSWITNWANASIGGNAADVDFQAPPVRTPGESRYYPTSPPAEFASQVYPIYRNFCVECHEPGSATAVTPYFAHDDIDTAYAAAQGVMNLNVPSNSRVVQRLANDNHNCWTDVCDDDAATLSAAIAAMANAITPTSPPNDLHLSNALVIADGTLAASGGRFDTNVIARYEFRTGADTVALDTSGIEPTLNLNLIGDVEWVGGWGIRINDGKAQGTTDASSKLSELIQASGAFSIEAWIVPATAAQDMANIVSYSAGTENRNFTLAQSDSRYSFALRHNGTSLNGTPALDTADETLQASLQHVVITYDVIDGRRIYVNGVDTGAIDMTTPDALNSWNNTYALVLGNEASSDRLWQGVIRFVAIHNRALTAPQVNQNFSAGVGERRFLLFGISDLIDEDNAYIGFQVSRFDNYAYLFAEPFFIDLDDDAAPIEFDLEGMRLGINGAEASVGQSWATLNTTMGGVGYQPTGQAISRLGTLVAVDLGEQQDEFFLTFARIGDRSRAYTEPTPLPFTLSPDATQADIGVRTFDEINASMSALTGVPQTFGDVPNTYTSIRKQLPVGSAIDGFLTAHQIAIAQLSIEYCNALVEAEISASPQVPTFFAGLNYNTNANSISDADWRTIVIAPLVNNFVGNNLEFQTSNNAVTCELETLLLSDTSGSAACSASPSGRPTPAGLARCGGACDADRTAVATKAACAAALGSATMLIQ
ncbi:MAG: LamG domain-containing protein [Gammaproteobacteria bacterium]|nr:LamG domain-containing protein [Gammaproteobacteria bacterium]MBQ0775122.1 LamG domain-containing protein [Gammaproteobacteria bacterium]